MSSKDLIKLLLELGLPVTNTNLCLFDNCLPVDIKRNVFPNAVLDFYSDKKHILTANNQVGISEIIFILLLELSEQLISPSQIKLNYRLQEVVESHPELIKRYKSAFVSGIEYKTLDLSLINAVIANRVVILVPEPENLA